MGQEDVHIPFDGGCATHKTPAFIAFLYDFALRVVVMVPSVSHNLETTKQEVSHGRKCNQVATLREKKRRTEK